MDLEQDPDRASKLCREAHARLTSHLASVTDEAVSAPSLLPDWTVGHVLTHLARNADAHARRLRGALHARDVPKYTGGRRQRQQEITAGAGRPANVIVADLLTAQNRLENVFDDCTAAGWPNRDLRGGSHYPVAGCPAHRLREVEMHHVDLGLGYTPTDWPDQYVVWDLPNLLATVPDRLSTLRHRQHLTAWLAGRMPIDPSTALAPWGLW